MDFFHVFPENFFSLFASPNRAIYAEALLVLHRQYRQETRLLKSELVSRLVASMENRMLELEDEQETLFSLDNDATLSGRAHFLLRRFLATGWLELEPDLTSFEECYIIPGYATKILQVFHDLLYGRPLEYNGFVYSTYSNLRTADQDRDDYMFSALTHAHQATDQLWTSLRELLDGIRRYHQRLPQQLEVKTMLAEHFDEFRRLMSDRIYHPLKTFDSVPRFKGHIQRILREWLRHGSLLDAMAQSAVRRGEHNDINEARAQVIRMMGEILDIYDRLDELQRQIDRKNSAYTRASVERMQYYLHADGDMRGRLVEIIKALAPAGAPSTKAKVIYEASASLPLYRGTFVDDSSLYTEPRRRDEHRPVASSWERADSADIESELRAFHQQLAASISHRKVVEFILDQLGEKTSLTAEQLQLLADDEFIKLILAVTKSDERRLPYTIELKDGYVYVNGYRIPRMIITAKERRRDDTHVGE